MRVAKLPLLLGPAIVAVALVGLGFNYQKAPSAPRDGRFVFPVLHSLDAAYLGDTPAHRGKYGGLDGVDVNVALGDPVYRGDTMVGTITQIVWERVHGSLEIEFDPAPLQRVSVGHEVWVSIAKVPVKP